MKIYLAAASAEIELAERWMAALRGIGHEITFDWTRTIREVGHANPAVQQSPRPAVRGYALNDIRGVVDAKLFWFLLPNLGTSSSEAWVELGAAYINWVQWGWPRIIISGAALDRSIFTSLAKQTFPTHEEAFVWLTEQK